MTNDFAVVSVPEVAVTVNWNGPSLVGWPLSTPVPAASEIPGGSAPLATDQLIASEPPEATSLS